MRIALLSIRDAAYNSGEIAPALRLFGGLAIIERQLDVALLCGCTVVCCLADRLEPAVLALQHRAEGAGARFLVIRTARNLIGVGTVADEILVLSPGLLPDRVTIEVMSARPTILTLPAETGVPLGYERIDAVDAWAGAMVIRAALVEHLAALPEDADVLSALLRLALQTGTRRLRVDAATFDSGEWQLAPTQAALDERAARWIHSRAELSSFIAPGQAAAERIGVRLARDLMGRGGAKTPNIAGLVAGSVSLCASALEMPVAALVAAFSMALFAIIGRVIQKVTDAPSGARLSRSPGQILNWLLDPVVVIALIAAAPEADGWLRAYVPIVMIAALWLAARRANIRWRASFADRVSLCALLVLAAVLGISQATAAAITLVAMMALAHETARGED